MANISVPNTFVNNTQVADATQVNQNFGAITTGIAAGAYDSYWANINFSSSLIGSGLAHFYSSVSFAGSGTFNAATYYNHNAQFNSSVSLPTGALVSLGTQTGVFKVAAGVGTVTTIVNADVHASAAIALTKLAATTASRALVSDASGFITVASVTATELGYLSGVTSAIQTQLDAKAAGAASSTDLAVAKFSGTGGKTLINSGVSIDASNNMTGMANGFWTGPVGVLASAAPTSAALNVGGGSTSLSGTTQIGLRCALVGASDATARIIAFSTASTFGTTAASFTCGAVIGFFNQALTKGASSTMTRTLNMKLFEETAGTYNVMLSDVETWTANWAIYLETTRASLLTGGLQFSTSGGTKTTLNYYEENTFTITATGFTGSITGTARFVRVGSVVTMFIPQLSGTSNATTFTLTGVPSRLVPARDQTTGAHRIENNGTQDWGIIIIDSDGTFYLFRTAAAAAWTNSGAKTLYETMVTYHLN
jgi:hypothetical protein